VQLEAADSVGTEPPFIPEEVNPPAATPSTQKVVPTAVSVVSGDTPGLYGGTKTNECNVAGIERYLVANPDRGQAWARAQGIDPGAIHRVLTSLTPVTLRTDTAVTNHGFKNGSLTQFQSVLQAGTAVLVDIRGVPRVRCYCGNPLLRPEQPPSVRYEGPTWTDFSTESVTVIKKAPAPVVEFVVVERDTKKVVSRPRATSGDKDHDADPVITEKVKDKPIGEGTTSRSDASTGSDKGANGPNGGAPAPPVDRDNPPADPGDPPANRINPPVDPADPPVDPADPGDPPANSGNPPANPDDPANPNNPPVDPAMPGDPADQRVPPVDRAVPPAAPVDPVGPPVHADPVAPAEVAPVKPRAKAPIKKEPPAKKPAADSAPDDPPAPHGGSKGNGNGSGSGGGSGSAASNSGGSDGGGDSGGGDSGSSGKG
jgi:hypothetical protein